VEALLPAAQAGHGDAPGQVRKRPAEETGFLASTEKGFLAKRREAAAASAKSAESAGVVAPGADWGDGHDKELLFSSKKLDDKAIDAFAENSLLPREVTPQVRASAATKFRQRVADQQARARKAQRDKAAEQGLSAGAILLAIARKPTFVGKLAGARSWLLPLASMASGKRRCTKQKCLLYSSQGRLMFSCRLHRP
jgi:hypothetical protein